MAKFNLGDKVRITSCAEYDGKFYQMNGLVVRVLFGSEDYQIGVCFENITNSRSQYGCFWFPAKHLSKNTSYNPCRKPDFKSNKEVSLMPGYKPVLISFLNGTNKNRTYTYACYDEVKKDDLVAVMTGHHGKTLACVVDPDPTDPEPVQYGREVIAVIDTSAYDARQANARKAAELRAQMDKRVRELQQVNLYEMMAARDPEMKAMLDEFKTLTGINTTPEPFPPMPHEATEVHNVPDTTATRSSNQNGAAAPGLGGDLLV